MLNYPDNLDLFGFLVLNYLNTLTSLFFAEEVATSTGHVFPRRCININMDVYLIKLHVLQKPSTSFPPHWLVSESGYSLPEHRFWWNRDRCYSICSSISLLSISDGVLSIFPSSFLVQENGTEFSLEPIMDALAAKHSDRRYSLSIYLTSATFKILRLRRYDWKQRPVLQNFGHVIAANPPLQPLILEK